MYSQPICFLSPLYTEQDEGKQLKPLVGIENAPGTTLADVFDNDENKDSKQAETDKDKVLANRVSVPF